MNVHNAAPTVVDGHAYRTFRSDIQALRAVAVLVVLLFHVEFFATPAGFLGVDIFFVISGFVITSQIVRETEAGSFSFTQFYIRRSRRIFPAAVLTVAATVTIGALLLPINEFRSLGISALHSLLGMANLFFWRESGYFDTSAVTKPLLHMWSLSVEEQFYLAWPLLLVVAARTRRASWRCFADRRGNCRSDKHLDRILPTRVSGVPVRVRCRAGVHSAHVTILDWVCDRPRGDGYRRVRF
jgi:peptidoglycan/LPS O-acetylase OafA/YrhL